MKVFFSSELMVWLSLTPVRMIGPMWYNLDWCGAGLPQLPIFNLPCGAGAEALFLSNNNAVLLSWESHLQNYFRYSDLQNNFRHCN